MAPGASDPFEFAQVSDAIGAGDHFEADLTALCDDIGARMAGTAGMRGALRWARASFEKAGLSSVRLEPVPMPLRWSEGDTRVEVLEPEGYQVRAASSALSPAIQQGEEGDLVHGGTGEPGFITRAREWFQGKILLVRLDEAASFDELAIEQRDAMVAIREAAEVQARAVLFISTRPNRLLYRHINNISGRLDPIPSALVAREDGLRMDRALSSGVRVRVRIEMPNRIGPAYQTANVVADLPGDEVPEEIVLLGAHLDSWDMGTGCLDNAVNVALVMSVARSIRASGLQPRRTLRFVLFGGEELGLFGSRAYVDLHGPELDRHVAVIVHDMGNGPLIGYSAGGRKELLPKLEALFDRSNRSTGLRHTNDPFFMSDNFTFMLHGVPSLFAVQDTSGFFLTYHSEADTFDKVRMADLKETARTAATAVLGIAETEPRFADRLREDQVRVRMRSAGLIRHLRFIGVWDTWRPTPDSEKPNSR